APALPFRAPRDTRARTGPAGHAWCATPLRAGPTSCPSSARTPSGLRASSARAGPARRGRRPGAPGRERVCCWYSHRLPVKEDGRCVARRAEVAVTGHPRAGPAGHRDALSAVVVRAGTHAAPTHGRSADDPGLQFAHVSGQNFAPFELARLALPLLDPL